MSVREMRRQQNREIAEQGGRILGSSKPIWHAETIGQGILGHAPTFPLPDSSGDNIALWQINRYWASKRQVPPADVTPPDLRPDKRLDAYCRAWAARILPPFLVTE